MSVSDLQSQLTQWSASLGTSLVLAGLAAIGAAAVVKTLFAAVRVVWVFFLRPGRNLKKLGEWAVVTGATDGIGKAYAEALAKRGRVPSINLCTEPTMHRCGHAWHACTVVVATCLQAQACSCKHGMAQEVAVIFLSYSCRPGGRPVCFCSCCMHLCYTSAVACSRFQIARQHPFDGLFWPRVKTAYSLDLTEVVMECIGHSFLSLPTMMPHLSC